MNSFQQNEIIVQISGELRKKDAKFSEGSEVLTFTETKYTPPRIQAKPTCGAPHAKTLKFSFLKNLFGFAAKLWNHIAAI